MSKLDDMIAKSKGTIVNVPSLLDESILPDLDMFAPAGSDFLDTNANTSDSARVLDYIELPAGEIDPRLKLLSHSSRTTLHTCPRKYQLYRMSSEQISLEKEKEVEQGVTFAYGSAVGVGIASVLEGKTETQVLMDTFLEWDVDLLDENPRQKKSFWLAAFAVQKFLAMREDDFLEDYELVIYNGKPAVELAFQVLLPNGFTYRGFVDAVLRHKTTGDIMVLECKTSSSTAQPATYKNSGQAVGYSVVLDVMFPELSSYTVLYLVYESKSYAFKQLPFQKSLLQRALWLQELLIDTQVIELYESYETYPLHGESCYSFFRDCEYLSLCTLDTANLTKPLTQDILDKIEQDSKRYEFTVSFEELVASQIAKGAE
jgi:hypothetical protein